MVLVFLVLRNLTFLDCLLDKMNINILIEKLECSSQSQFKKMKTTPRWIFFSIFTVAMQRRPWIITKYRSLIQGDGFFCGI